MSNPHAADQPNPGGQVSAADSPGRGLSGPIADKVGAGLAIALIGLFVAIGWAVIATVDDPPLLADVPAMDAPTVAPNESSEGSPPSTPGTEGPIGTPPYVGEGHAGEEQAFFEAQYRVELSPTPSTDEGDGEDAHAVLEPQHRGAFDPNARLVALLAVVSPMMTTLVAFYFGSRTGATAAAEATTTAAEAKQQSADANQMKVAALVAGLEVAPDTAEFAKKLRDLKII